MKKISLCLFTLLLSATVILSSCMVWQEFADRKRERKAFDALAKIVSQLGASVPAERTDTDGENLESADMGPVEQRRNLVPLYEANSDFLGWLCIPGTEVDYPVMHTPNDPQKYLRRSFNGEYSSSGVPFLDYRCNPDSDNLLIYGHNMGNGTMFAALNRYTDKDYLAEHSVIEWETESGCERYKIFAVACVQKTDGWYNFIDASDPAAFYSKISDLQCKTVLTTDVVPIYGQQLLTLSTCRGSGRNGRLLVVAVSL